MRMPPRQVRAFFPSVSGAITEDPVTGSLPTAHRHPTSFSCSRPTLLLAGSLHAAFGVWLIGAPHVTRAFRRLTFGLIYLMRDLVRSGPGPPKVHVETGKCFHSSPLLSVFQSWFFVGKYRPDDIAPRSPCTPPPKPLTPLLQGSQLHRDGVVHVEQQVKQFSPICSRPSQRNACSGRSRVGGRGMRPGVVRPRHVRAMPLAVAHALYYGHTIPPPAQCKYHKYMLTTTQPQERATHLTTPVVCESSYQTSSLTASASQRPSCRDRRHSTKHFGLPAPQHFGLPAPQRALTHSMGRSRHIFCNAAMRVSNTIAACERSTQGQAIRKAATAEQGG